MIDIIIIVFSLIVLYSILASTDNTFKRILTLSISILLVIGSFMYIYSDSFNDVDKEYAERKLQYNIKNTIKKIGLNDLDLDFKIKQTITYGMHYENNITIKYKDIKVSVHTINSTSKEITYSYRMVFDNFFTLFNKKELVTETLKVEMVPKSDTNINDNVDYVFTKL